VGGDRQDLGGFIGKSMRKFMKLMEEIGTCWGKSMEKNMAT